MTPTVPRHRAGGRLGVGTLVKRELASGRKVGGPGGAAGGVVTKLLTAMELRLGVFGNCSGKFCCPRESAECYALPQRGK